MIINWFFVKVIRVISLGKKPNKGGRPPRDKNKIINHILFEEDNWENEFVWDTDFIKEKERVIIIGSKDKV